ARTRAHPPPAPPPPRGGGGGPPRPPHGPGGRAQDRPGTPADPGVPYAFEGGPDGLRVSFACPVCHQRIRVPVRGRVRARCGLCRTVLDCST
ncbi:hypothetical protein ACFV01_27300, partial [Streptomyces sp. NPDC059616]